MTKKVIVTGVVIIALVGGYLLLSRPGKAAAGEAKVVQPFYGSIERSIITTGTVKPQNRLEIKPPIAGRIDKILVEEGQKVKTGDILALMSSTERAALLDAARIQGEAALKKWEEAYKPAPLVASIDGEVIVKGVNPGQTVTTSDAVVVLSDRLIVQAQVDETDIGKVKVGQSAIVTLDAYPQIEVKSKVDHIYYESTTVNNVTIYEVDILPETVPDVFRSGMSANVQIIQEHIENALLLPLEAVSQQNGKSFVMVVPALGQKPAPTEVQTGLSDDKNIQILSGVAPKDVVVQEAVVLKSNAAKSSGTNPFMPTPPGGKRSK